METTAHISDSITTMYEMAAIALQQPPGTLNDWEEHLLCNFIAMYWNDDITPLIKVDNNDHD